MHEIISLIVSLVLAAVVCDFFKSYNGILGTIVFIAFLYAFIGKNSIENKN